MADSHLLPLRSDGRVHPRAIQDAPAPSVTRPRPTKSENSVVQKKYSCAKCHLDFFDAAEFVNHHRSEHPEPGAGEFEKLALKEKERQQRAADKRQAKIQRNELRSAAGQTEAVTDHKTLTLEEMSEKQRLLGEASRIVKQLRRSYPRAQLCHTCLEIFKSDMELVEHHKAHLAVASAPLVITKKKNKGLKTAKNLPQKVSRRGTSNPGLPRAPSVVKIDSVNSSPNGEQDMRERRMDATYGMGEFARDHGQFGSAPSFDSMDDESSA